MQLSEAYWRLIMEGALNTHGSKNTLEVEWYDGMTDFFFVAVHPFTPEFVQDMLSLLKI